MATEVCAKSIYAYQKVQSAIRDHEADVDVSVSVPKTRAKVVVVGSSGVGKTSVIYRHRYGNRSASFTSTIGASFVECEVETSYENINLQIWDTAGQERFRCMVPMYMRNSAAAIIMYDITNRQSFEDVDKWNEELHKCCGISDPVVVLIGNKCDLFDKRRVSTAEGQAKALSLDARFYEISAEKPITFSLMLEDLCHDLLSGPCANDISSSVSSLPSNIVRLTSSSASAATSSSKTKARCCGFM
ncbi:Ras family protein [Oesophagostomum dentatum]|uniref:Ras family protein n=1 Tax=Oesophagostomum dentatum TaxID=61180 RepID=A0A0B1TRF3_OESDE|nr:Ras family protein [Oesophagostomum dentatum]